MTTFAKVNGLPPDVAQQIRPLFDDREWPVVADEVMEGHIELFRINDDSFALTRIETEINELVIVGYIGQRLTEFADAMIRLAKSNGIESIRFHSRRPGLARLIRKLSPQRLETVYRVTL